MCNILTKEDVEMTIPITLLVYYTNSPTTIIGSEAMIVY